MGFTIPGKRTVEFAERSRFDRIFRVQITHRKKTKQTEFTSQRSGEPIKSNNTAKRFSRTHKHFVSYRNVNYPSPSPLSLRF